MEPETPGSQRLIVFADYCQFFLQDLDAHGAWMRSHGADPELAPAGWTEEAVYGHQIGVEPYSLAIGTARRDNVEVSLRISRRAPAADPEGAEHVVEADLGLPGGDLAICEVGDDLGKSDMSVSQRAATAYASPICPPGRPRARTSPSPAIISCTRSTCGLLLRPPRWLC
jgi:hypothetical protein